MMREFSENRSVVTTAHVCYSLLYRGMLLSIDIQEAKAVL
jgi:hypothetical protein